MWPLCVDTSKFGDRRDRRYFAIRLPFRFSSVRWHLKRDQVLVAHVSQPPPHYPGISTRQVVLKRAQLQPVLTNNALLNPAKNSHTPYYDCSIRATNEVANANKHALRSRAAVLPTKP